MKEISKKFLTDLKNFSTDNNLYKEIWNKACEKYSYSDVDEKGRNLLSLYIIFKHNMDIKMIDKLYKKGCIIQKEFLQNPNFINYIDVVFKNKQKDRTHYFDQTDIPENKRLIEYMSIATNYRFDFFKKYKKHIDSLNGTDLLIIFYKNLNKDFPFKLEIDEKNKKLIIDELTKDKINPLTFTHFDKPENIYNFGIFHIINKEIGHYMETYSIKPEFFKEKLEKDFPGIYKDYVELKSYIEKKVVESSLNFEEDLEPHKKNRL